MKKFLLSLAAVGLTLIAAARSPAQDDAKPLLVLSLPSVESLVKSVGYLGTVAGHEGLDKLVEDQIKEKAGGLKGLDRTKPIGLAATTDGAGFQFLGFVPASDAESLLSLSPFPAEDAGDGMKKIGTPFGSSVYLKNKGGWLFLSNEAGSLGKVPEDPTKLLDGMDKSYDLGLRFFMQNIPAFYKGLAIAGIREQVGKSLKQKPDESDEDFGRREKIVKQQIDTLVKTINDLDKITLGWKIDSSAKKLLMEVAVTAADGSDTAKRYAAQADVRSNFSGFWSEAAVMSAVAASKMTADEAAQLSTTLAEGKKAILKEIDKSEDFDNEAAKAKVKDVFGKLWDVLDGTVKSGQIDLGVTILGEGPFTLAVGLGVADGAAADKALRDAIKIAEGEEALAKVEYDVDKADDVTFHSITPKLGDKADHATKVLGSDPKIVIGVGKKSLYLAVGTDAVKSLKGLMDKSKATATKPIGPGQLLFSLAPALKFAAKQDPTNTMLGKIAESVKPGNDHIRITSKVITNGEASRIEVEEGVLKLIANAAMMFRDARAGAAAFGAADKAEKE